MLKDLWNAPETMKHGETLTARGSVAVFLSVLECCQSQHVATCFCSKTWKGVCIAVMPHARVDQRHCIVRHSRKGVAYLDIHWLQISVQGRFWFDFFPVSLNLSISKKKWQFHEKNLPLHVFMLSHVESAWAFPPFSRVFPLFSREFPPRKIDIFLRKGE